MLGLAMKIRRAFRRAQGGKPTEAWSRGACLGEAVLGHEPVDRIDSPHLGKHQIRGGIVADDYHQCDEVFDGKIGARIERANDAGPGAAILIAKFHAVGKGKLTGFDLAESFHHKGNLDGAHRIHLPSSVDGNLFARFQAFDVDAPGCIHRARDTLDRGAETIKRSERGLRSLGEKGERERSQQ